MRRPSGELIAYIVLVAVALALRLYDLGDRPFHHDESQDAYFSWVLWTKGDYKYMPILHGPLRFYLTAGVFSLFGDSDFTARLAPALMGTSMVAMPYFLRDQLGRVAAFTAAVLLAIGPSYLYFSRFAREDIYFAAISFALLVVVFRFLDRPRFWGPPAIGALIALGFATKETMYIAGFVAFTFFVILLIREGRGGPTRAALRSVGWEAYVWGLAACDGPGGFELPYRGETRSFFGYSARGPVGEPDGRDDGTITPSAALGALPFAPEIAIPCAAALMRQPGLFGRYGFVDSFNPSFRYTHARLGTGSVDPNHGWVASDCLGIDQGPILLQAANYRDDFIWRHISRVPAIRQGLMRAGFTGGWLR